MYIIANGAVITRDPDCPLLQNGAVVTNGETIAAVGNFDVLKKAYPDADFVDAHGGLILPGLINAHTHIYSALARGLSVRGYHPQNFLDILEGMWWNIDRKLTLGATYASAMETYLECIKNGVTTVFDHHASYCEITGSLDAIAKAAKETGVRSCLCYEVSDRDGEEKCLAAIKENVGFIDRCARQKDNMQKAMFGLHAAFTLSDRTLAACAEQNGGKTGFHIHVAEGMNDVYDSRRRYGKATVERLLDFGILGEKTILGHCIHLTPAEMDIIKQTGSMVVNNPQSNMSNAVGCAPVLQLFEKGILVGLGTDAYTHDMLESMKTVLTIQRHNACLPDVGWTQAVSMLFVNNPKIAARYFDSPLGVLKPGAAADVIVMDYAPYTPLTAENIDGHILFGLNGRHCRTTMVNGKLLMKDREILCVDEQRIHENSRKEAQKLWKNINA